MKNTRQKRRKYFRNFLFHTAVMSLVFLLILTRTAAATNPAGVQTETNSQDPGSQENKASGFSLDVYTPITAFQTHFDHSFRIIITLHFEIISGIRDMCFRSDFLNNYFHALFQFIIATKAP